MLTSAWSQTSPFLLVALFDHVSDVEGLGDSIHSVLTEPDPVAALDEFAAHLGRIRPRVRAVATAIQRQRRSDPDFAAHWEVVFRDQRHICRHLVNGLHRAGLLADTWTVATATDMLWALMSGDFADNLTIDCGWSFSKYTERLDTSCGPCSSPEPQLATAAGPPAPQAPGVSPFARADPA
jgi:hypothetical protein